LGRGEWSVLTESQHAERVGTLRGPERVVSHRLREGPMRLYEKINISTTELATMPPCTRRALLTAAGTGVVASLAGCGSLVNNSPLAEAPPVGELDGYRVFIAEGVDFPNPGAVSSVKDSASADVSVYPSGDDQVQQVRGCLTDGRPAVVVGANAQWTVMQACADSDRRYGFTQNGWGPTDRIAAAVPKQGRLDTHKFVGAELPRDLPWAVSEVLEPSLPECPEPLDLEVPDGATTIGRSRIRGVNDVGGFDRWDTLRLAAKTEPAVVSVDMQATMYGGSTQSDTSSYKPDRIRFVSDFPERITGMSPQDADIDGLTVETTGSAGSETTLMQYTFTPQEKIDLWSFAACTRMQFQTRDTEPPISYDSNGRFRWRDPQLLDDDTWVHHTPGQAVWYPNR
jgi:hypothetical protein